jgi:hypothetical protein
MDDRSSCEPEPLVAPPLGPHEGADLIEPSTEIYCGEKGFESARGTIPLFDATLENHFSEVPQIQFVAQTSEDHRAHDICRMLEAIERYPSAFIQDTSAVTTAETAIAECGAIRAFGGGRRRVSRMSRTVLALSQLIEAERQRWAPFRHALPKADQAVLNRFFGGE